MKVVVCGTIDASIEFDVDPGEIRRKANSRMEAYGLIKGMCREAADAEYVKNGFIRDWTDEEEFDIDRVITAAGFPKPSMS